MNKNNTTESHVWDSLIRKALKSLVEKFDFFLENIRSYTVIDPWYAEEYKGEEERCKALLDKCREVLASPPCNRYSVDTEEEAWKIHDAICKKYKTCFF